MNIHAFGREDEARIIERLRADGLVLVSLVADGEDGPGGHKLFSRLPIGTQHGDREAVALAPMAVVPGAQRRGIGTALATSGLERCRALGERLVVVLVGFRRDDLGAGDAAVPHPRSVPAGGDIGH